MWLVISGLGVGVLLSYAVVIGNVAGLFPLASTATSSSFFESPYWVGIPPDTARAITALQPVAAVGYAVWVPWALEHMKPQSEKLFDFDALLIGFLLSALAWPYVTYAFLVSPSSVTRALICVCTLWISAFCTCGLLCATFWARAPAVPTIGVLFLTQVVCLADGLGWSAACLRVAAAARSAVV